MAVPATRCSTAATASSCTRSPRSPPAPTPVAAPENDLTVDVDAMLARVTRQDPPRLPRQSQQPDRHLSVARRGDAAPRRACRPRCFSSSTRPIPSSSRATTTSPASSSSKAPRTSSCCAPSRRSTRSPRLRLGWAYCSAGVADVLNRVRNPFNVNLRGAGGGRSPRSTTSPRVDRAREHNDVWRPWLEDASWARSVSAPRPPSPISCWCAFRQSRKDASAAFAFLKSRGILVRKMGAYGLARASSHHHRHSRTRCARSSRRWANSSPRHERGSLRARRLDRHRPHRLVAGARAPARQARRRDRRLRARARRRSIRRCGSISPIA